MHTNLAISMASANGRSSPVEGQPGCPLLGVTQTSQALALIASSTDDGRCRRDPAGTPRGASLVHDGTETRHGGVPCTFGDNTQERHPADIRSTLCGVSFVVFFEQLFRTLDPGGDVLQRRLRTDTLRVQEHLLAARKIARPKVAARSDTRCAASRKRLAMVMACAPMLARSRRGRCDA